MNADGTDPKRITSFGGWPTWSPDGKPIAFDTVPPSGSLDYEIWVVDVDGSNPTNITNSNATRQVRDRSGSQLGPHAGPRHRRQAPHRARRPPRRARPAGVGGSA